MIQICIEATQVGAGDEAGGAACRLQTLNTILMHTKCRPILTHSSNHIKGINRNTLHNQINRGYFQLNITKTKINIKINMKTRDKDKHAPKIHIIRATITVAHHNPTGEDKMNLTNLPIILNPIIKDLIISQNQEALLGIQAQIEEDNINLEAGDEDEDEKTE